jgi:hypothetical protein
MIRARCNEPNCSWMFEDMNFAVVGAACDQHHGTHPALIRCPEPECSWTHLGMDVWDIWTQHVRDQHAAHSKGWPAIHWPHSPSKSDDGQVSTGLYCPLINDGAATILANALLKAG